VRTIRSVPLKLRDGSNKAGREIEVRGEAYLARQIFEKINADREEEGEARLPIRVMPLRERFAS